VARIDAFTLDGTSALLINGTATGDFAGYSVSSAGDLNGDGFEDVIFGATGYDIGGDVIDPGGAFVIFGGPTSVINGFLGLQNLDGSDGFRISVYDSYSLLGASVSAAGDINGDGFDDLIIGAPNSEAGIYSQPGDAYILFGQDTTVTPFSASIDLTYSGNVTNFSDSTGYAYQRIGRSVSGGGDFNGDGIDDVIIGAYATPSGVPNGAGSAYIVFGTNAGFGATFDLASLDGADGFVLNGEASYDQVGFSVSNAGDVNGDGVDDIIVGAPGAPGVADGGEAYVVFGSTTGPGVPSVSPGDLTGANGFRVTGFVDGAYGSSLTGFSVSSAGDVNGDGFDDVIVGAQYATPTGYADRYSGQAFVIFGSGAGFASTISVTALNGADGFAIDGADVFHAAGESVSAAGDVNGDGFDDLFVGAPGVSGGSGEAFVVFGAASFAATFDLADLFGVGVTPGVRITGAYGGENAGAAVSTAGDFNGDGFDDMVIGAPGYAGNRGRAVVVGGENFDLVVDIVGGTGNDTLTISSPGQSVVANTGDDLVLGGLAGSAINGGSGDDTLEILDSGFLRIDGGTGTDTLRFGAGVNVDFSAAGDQKVRDIEAIDLAGGAGTNVTLDTLSVLALSTESNLIKVSTDGLGDVFLADETNWAATFVSNETVILKSGNAELELDADTPLLTTFALPPVSVLELSALDAAEGLIIRGDATRDTLGYSVSSAGDINGDGFEDFILGAPDSNYLGSGYGYQGGGAVIFGAPALDFKSTLADVTAGNGFRFIGGPYDNAGFHVAAAGDVNGDGFADVAIGFSFDSDFSSRSYVVFGSDQPFAVDIDLTALDGADGFSLDAGGGSTNQVGTRIDSAGDFNGDGFDDLILDGYFYPAEGKVDAGAAFVVFGTDAGFDANLDVTTLTGANGFQIAGPSTYDMAGIDVSSAGDVNGDGLDDLLIGVEDFNGLGPKVVVVFGTQAAPGATLDLGLLDAATGFTLDNAYVGSAVSSAGDVNGDGFLDIIVGAPDAAYSGYSYSGSSFVVFGTGAGFGVGVDLLSLDGSNGFRVDGLDADHYFGTSVSSAGDVNGDGFDDLIIGARGYSGDGGAKSGTSAVVFGKAAGFTAVLGTAPIDGYDGFLINEAVVGDRAGQSVSGAGDINGDGFDDLLIGAPRADYGGIYNQGAAFVVFGQDTGAVTQLGDETANTLLGGSGIDVLVGGRGDDLQIGGGGADVLIGAEGDDILQVDDLTFQRVDGGTGFDTLRFAGTNLLPDFTAIGTQLVSDIEAIDLVVGSGDRVTLDALSVLSLSDTSNTLRITGSGSEALFLTDAGWRSTALDSSVLTLENGAATIIMDRGLGLVVPNTPPVPADDLFTVDEDSSVSGNVLVDNGAGADFDADGDLLVVDGAPTVNGANGSAIVNTDGSFTYTPDADFVGADTFVYTVRDFTGGVAQGTVTITVNQVNDDPVAADDLITTDEDTNITGSLLVDNGNGVDTDLESTTLFVSPTPSVDVANGTLVLNANGNFSYTPDADFNGTDSFVYTLFDGDGGSDLGTATITVIAINDDPVAVNDAVTTDEDTVLNGDVLADNGGGGDFDIDGDTLTVATSPLVDVANGSLTIDASGAFIYMPDADFNGTDSFVYSLEDGVGGSAAGTVAITVSPVNDAPIAADDAFSVDEDQSVAGNVFDDNGNGVDTDLESRTLFVSPTPSVDVANSTLVLNANGNFTYTPDADFNGTDSFVYTLFDGAGGSDLGTVAITVDPVNDDPVAQPDAFATAEDVALSGDVLADNGFGVDQDVDGDTLTVSTMPSVDVANGMLALSANGAFTYTPNTNFNGTDSFVYLLEDGAGGSAFGTVDLTVTSVNDAPVAANDAISVDEDEVVAGNVFIDNGAGVDSDVESMTLFVSPTPSVDVANGVLVLNANGNFTYTPDADFNGADSFVYTLFDGDGGSDLGTVAITVNPVNDDPVAALDAFTTAEDAVLAGDVLADNGFGLDQDIDGDGLTVSTTPSIDVANGQLDLNDDGTFTYTPDANFNGNDSFVYLLEDGVGGSAFGTVDITVTPVNDDPVAVDDAFSILEDAVLSGDVLADNGFGLDFDVDGDGLLVGTNPDVLPANGSVTLSASGTFTYTPNANFNGTDSFVYTLFDGNGGSDLGAVTITVTPVNDAPTALDTVRAATFEDDAPFSIDLSTGAVDIDGDTLTVSNLSLISGDDSGFSLSGNTLLVDPGGYDFLAVGETESVRFRYDISDGNGVVVDQRAVVNIRGVNDAPTPADDVFNATEDAPLADNVLDNDDDPDGDALIVDTTPLTNVANGGLDLLSDGGFVYTPNADFNGSDSFVYAVSDGNGGSAAATVTITVDPVNDAPTVLDTVRDKADASDAPFAVDLLTGASDIDGDALSVADVRLISGDDSGVTIAGDTLLIDPSFYAGLAEDAVESIRYRFNVIDGFGGLVDNRAVINIRAAVNGDPVAADDSFVTDQATRLTGNLFADNGAGPDIDPNGDALQAATTPVVDVVNGGVTIAADGSFAYSPDANFVGTDSFVYRVFDDEGASDLGTVDITVAEDLSSVVVSGPGNDNVIGDGTTVLRYDQGGAAALFADLRAGFINAPGFGVDQVSGIFEVRSTEFDDFLFGTNGVPGAASPPILLGAFESFAGMAGNDVIFGAGGLDRANYAQSPGGVNVDLSASIALDDGFGDSDSLFGIEGVQGTNFADRLIGEDGDNFFQPQRGADVIDGGLGVDSLVFTGLGSDILVDLETGQIVHRNGDIATVANVENVETGAGRDEVRADGADNRIIGNAGDDFLSGRAGDDRIQGGGGGDRLFGNSGDDVLLGAAGADRLSGSEGFDRLNGGAGDDDLRGGSEGDEFIFGLGSGVDLVTDFASGQDQLNVSAYGFGNFAALQPFIVSSDEGVQINLNGSTDVIRLAGVAVADLDADDFIF